MGFRLIYDILGINFHVCLQEFTLFRLFLLIELLELHFEAYLVLFNHK